MRNYCHRGKRRCQGLLSLQGSLQRKQIALNERLRCLKRVLIHYTTDIFILILCFQDVDFFASPRRPCNWFSSWHFGTHAPRCFDPTPSRFPSLLLNTPPPRLNSPREGNHGFLRPGQVPQQGVRLHGVPDPGVARPGLGEAGHQDQRRGRTALVYGVPQESGAPERKMCDWARIRTESEWMGDGWVARTCGCSLSIFTPPSS